MPTYVTRRPGARPNPILDRAFALKREAERKAKKQDKQEAKPPAYGRSKTKEKR